jgi:hypothetical protein
VLRAAQVRRDVAETFRLFTEQIGAWWPLGRHGMFGGRAAGVSLVDGRLVERSETGETTVWAEVVDWQPPARLALAWHPGRDASAAGRVEINFTPVDDGTRVELIHHGWEAFGDLAERMHRSYSRPNAWGFVLDHFADATEAAREREVSTGLEVLSAAYDAFFAEALAGGFGEPEPGEWTAEQVVAHIAVNDDSLAAVCRTLIDQGSPRLDNALPNDRAVLAATIASVGDLEAMVALGRERSQTLMLLLTRLDADQLATEVPSHLIDGDRVVLDRPLPWASLAIQTQADFHLPLHTRQLAGLRS